MLNSLRKYTAEFIGTYAVVFCGTGAIIINEEFGGMVTHVGIAITFGLIVMSMIYAFGNISCAHVNPAVNEQIIDQELSEIMKDITSSESFVYEEERV